MTYALRCKAVSPSKLTDPRTCRLRSESIHRANLSVFGLINANQRTPLVIPEGSFGETLVTPISGPLGLDEHGELCGSRRAARAQV
jgi:hypothetical protein